VLFKNPRDAIQFATLARQMYPNDSRFAVEVYRDATSLPFGYLLVDLKPEQDDKYRLRTDIFLGDDTRFVYVKK